MLKREWGVESNGSYRIYSNPGNTAALVPEFTVENLQPRFLALAVKDLPLGIILDGDYDDDDTRFDQIRKNN